MPPLYKTRRENGAKEICAKKLSGDNLELMKNIKPQI